MRFIHYTAFATLALGSIACSGSSQREPDRDIPILVQKPEVIDICCDGSGEPPGTVGSIEIEVLELGRKMAPGSFGGHIAYSDRAVPAPARLSVPDGYPLSPGKVTIDIKLDGCDFSEILVAFTIEARAVYADSGNPLVTEETVSVTIRNTCPQAPRTVPASLQAERLVETILGRNVPDFADYARPAPAGVPTDFSDPSQPSQVPTAPHTETIETGYVVAELDQARLDLAFTGPAPSFPVGFGTNAYTLGAEQPIEMTPGRYLIAWQVVDGEVPLEDPNGLEYAFVVDSDNDATNNYQGEAPFTADFFNDTDLWFTAEQYLETGWRMRVRSAVNGDVAAIPSAARWVMKNDAQVFVVPLDELAAEDRVGTRFSAYSDGSASGLWSGDTTPTVAAGLHSIDLTVDWN